MKDTTKEILNDLYKVDESLKQYEDKLKEYILDFEKMKPDTQFSDGFKTRLQKQIINTIQYHKSTTDNSKKSISLFYITKWFFSGAFFSLMVLFGVFSLLNLQVSQNGKSSFLVSDQKENTQINNDLQQLSLETNDEMESNDLDTIKNMKTMDLQASDESGLPNPAPSPNRKSNENTVNEESTVSNFIEDNVESLALSDEYVAGDAAYGDETAPRMLKSGEGLGGGLTMQGFAPENTMFSYNGNLKSQLDIVSQKPVFQVDKKAENMQFDSLMKGVKIANLDISKLKNLTVSNIDFVANLGSQYRFNLNVTNGDVDIYLVQNGNGVVSNSMGTEIPVDEKVVLSLSESFVQGLGINLAAYGKPMVDKKTSYGGIANILYPLVIDNTNVYETWGEPYGMIVQVDIAQQKIARLYNYNMKGLVIADYKNQINKSKIIETYTTNLSGSISLTSPEIVYTKSYNQDGYSFIPTIKFQYKENNNIVNHIIDPNNFK